PPVAAPPVAASRADDARRRAEFDEVEKIFRRGYVDAAMKRWRAMSDFPPAVARMALLENRPEAVLAIPVANDPPLLKAHGRTALLPADVAPGPPVLPPFSPLPRPPPPSPPPPPPP